MLSMKLLIALLIALLVPLSSAQTQSPSVLTYLSLGTTSGVSREEVGHFDDGVSNAIHIPKGFPMGSQVHNLVYIGTNGYITFSQPFYEPRPEAFPGGSTAVSSLYIVAPYWDDIDIRREGNIYYEVHSNSSSALLSQVNNFINTVDISGGDGFVGSWMLVVQWDKVHSWPSGEDDDTRDIYQSLFGIDISLNNTFQAIVITDGIQSYSVFTYKCGELQWYSNISTIGFNAASEVFENHPDNGSSFVYEPACSNTSDSPWYNIVYKLSVTLTNGTTAAPPPTVEPPQVDYLTYLETGSNTLPPCRNCSSPAIVVEGEGIPIGNYFHRTVYVGTNGIISFGSPFALDNPALFPTQQASIYYSYVVAPYWADIDTRLAGTVYYKTYSLQNASEAQTISAVESFVNNETGSLTGSNWMLVATWTEVHPFPHGSSAEQDRQDPHLQSTNTFQAILISDGQKTYSVFTYKCGDIEWSGGASIGYNSAGDYYYNHSLSGTQESAVIGCVHTHSGSMWNNVIFDLSPVMASGTAPPPPSTIGSCVAAGYTECCTSGQCTGQPISDCFCDHFCVTFGDCCHDQASLCSINNTSLENETYVVYADHFYIGRMSVTGTDFQLIPFPQLNGAFSIDFDYGRGYLYWSDYIERAIFRGNLDGSGITKLVNTTVDIVEGLALDWVINILYWTESFHRNIEALDLDTMIRTPIISADPHSGLRDIAVDPSTRYMYWTDWGDPAKIERASMDGTGRRVLHSIDVVSPEGITVDYTSQMIYWTDSGYNGGTIQYSDTDGMGRETLSSDLVYPFAITFWDNLVFWTNLYSLSIQYTHKLDGVNVATIFPSLFTFRPAGIEVISENRQNLSTNYCEGHNCSHTCLLSSNVSRGYSCACQEGYELDSNAQDCNYVGTTAPPAEGTCVAGGYNDSCCTGGYCAGSPPTCFCDVRCHSRGDCCSDTACVVVESSCSAANYRTCCTDYSNGCAGISQFGVCYCDAGCRSFGDCCSDIDQTCPIATTSSPAVTTPNVAITSSPATTSSTAVTTPTALTILEFLNLNSTEGVDTESVGHFDDGVSHAIHVPGGILFGSLRHTFIFISTNGIISFGEPFYVLPVVAFPSIESTVAGSYLVSPFWSDVDITASGNIHYEVHSQNSSTSATLLSTVSDFISEREEVDFVGTWMMVAIWESVPPWPNGIIDILPFLADLLPDYNDRNTFQAVIITNEVKTYSVFTYKCGEMEWSRGGIIGFNAGGEEFENHPSSGVTGTPTIQCLNSPASDWVNVVYQLSIDNATTVPVPATIEPPQENYLPFLDFTGQAFLSASLPRCQNCSSDAISISSPGFPFGSYYHNVVFVGTNGLLSFDMEFRKDLPEPFPSNSDFSLYNAYVVAPFWSNIDTRRDGRVRYEVFLSSDNGIVSAERLRLVTDHITSEADSEFVDASWMLVATWDGVHPNPHGESAEQDREDPYLQSTNTFQAVLISNGTNSYAVFTYICNEIQWSDEATIGFNAGGTLFQHHPLSGRLQANAIDCVHTLNGSAVNNVIFNLSPVTPEGTVPPSSERVEIPFIIGTTDGVANMSLPQLDDAASEEILIDYPGFPFGNSYQSVAYVGTNGVISFGKIFILHTPTAFPSDFPDIYTNYIIAPFWADADITLLGAVSYEVHTNRTSGSRAQLEFVSRFITSKTNDVFNGTWMLVAFWDSVHPYAGIFPGPQANTFQAIAITDGNQSYVVYTYRCGDLEWSNGAVVGYNGGSASDYFFVHPLSGSDDAQQLACAEFPASEWSNLVYKVSIDSVVTEPPPSTSEPPQSAYLMFLNKTGINQEVLAGCDNCHSSDINLSNEPFPFGNYRHQVAFVSTNGIISFGEEFVPVNSVLFPSSTSAAVHYSYTVAPYWSNIDTRMSGEVWYEIHRRNQTNLSDQLLDRVSSFVNNQTDASEFVGTWMLVATWDDVSPYTGEGAFSTSSLTNTFQAVLITDGFKSYAIFTYKCDLIEWSNEATIGFNAAGDYFSNHSFSGSILTKSIDCVHQPTSIWNNEIFDLVPGELMDGSTPIPPRSFGSCILEGFSDCCIGFSCAGSTPGDCYCDASCFQFGDCCHDIDEICSTLSQPVNVPLVIANERTISLINGSSIENLVVIDYSASYLGIDYDYGRGFLYFSDVSDSTITRSNLDGSNPQVIVNSQIADIGDLAVDWVNNKLYWADAVYTQIEVLDLDSLSRRELVNTGPHTAPRGIAVDPSTRYMYWTDWGVGKIERASMDGTGREVLHDTGLVTPFGLTIDYNEQRIYWVDTTLERIEYSYVDGSQRVVLESQQDGLAFPSSITLHNDLLYWTDWINIAVYTTHKLIGQTILPIYQDFVFLPGGIEAITPDRQQQITNLCSGNTCSYMCLLSSTAAVGFRCACPDGSVLLDNERDCSNTSGITPTTPPVGSCVAAGYQTCCTTGYCSGLPPTCFCEVSCTFFDDCCEDFRDICSVGSVTTGTPQTTMVSMETTHPDTTAPDTTPPITSSPMTTPPITTPPVTAPPVTTPPITIPPVTAPPVTTPPITIPPVTAPPVTTPPITTPPVTAPPVTTPTITTPPRDCIGNMNPAESVTSLKLYPISASTLNITWTAPPLTLLRGYICDDDMYSISIVSFSGIVVTMVTVIGHQTTLLVNQGLERWIPYNVSVTAINMYGASPPLLNVTFTEEGVPPIPPYNVQVARNSDTEMTVSWDPLSPLEAKGFITSYTVTYTKALPANSRRRRQNDDTNELVVNPDTSNVTIINLSPDDAYIVTVRANTITGSGKESDPITSTAISVTGAPGLGEQTDGGTIAGGLIFGVVVIISIVSLIVILLIILRRRQKTYNVDENYARFNNEQQSVTINSEADDRKPSLAFGEPQGTDQRQYHRPPGEGTPSYENPTYGLIKGTSDYPDIGEPRYQEVKGQLEGLHIYDDPARLDETSYEVVKEDLSKEVPAYDDVVKTDVSFNEYQSLDQVGN